MMSRQDQKGITLVEMMVVIAIVSMLVTIAIPNYQAWVSDQNLRASVVQLAGDLQIARLTAINRNAPVTVSFNQAGSTYTAFVDDGTGVGGVARDLVKNGTEALIFINDPDPKPLKARVTIAQVDFAGGSAFLFNGRGMLGIPQAGNAQVDLQNDRGRQYRINVTLVGDVNVAAL